MNKQHNKTGLKIFLIIMCVLYIFSFWCTIDSLIENNKIQDMIIEFVDRDAKCTYSKYYKMNFCKIENRKKDITPSFTQSDKDKQFFVGSYGDIIISLESEMKSVFKGAIDFYTGGHAALVSDNGMVLEVTGLSKDSSKNVVRYSYNYWLYDQKTMLEKFIMRDSFLVLKVKNTTLQQRNKAMLKAQSYLGQPYNYSFLFNTANSHYCSDLISKVYEVINKDLNEDGFVTTPQDIVVSKDTQIFLYKEINRSVKDENGLMLGTHNIYYLDDGINYDFDAYL